MVFLFPLNALKLSLRCRKSVAQILQAILVGCEVWLQDVS